MELATWLLFQNYRHEILKHFHEGGPVGNHPEGVWFRSYRIVGPICSMKCNGEL